MLIPRVESQGRVLAVDDNPLILDVLKKLLTHEQLEVFTAVDGEAALDILRDTPVDLIVCDIMMPRLDGYGLHERVRATPEFAHIPFVFLTALADQAEVLEGKAIGADDYLTKPFNSAELVAVVKGKVARARALTDQTEQIFESYRKKVVHVLSHEFRTPLVAINTGAELLLEKQDSLDESKVRSLLQAIQRGGQRLERLVTDFMLLQQFEAGIPQRLFAQRAAPFAIESFFESWSETVRHDLHKKGWEVETRKLVQTGTKVFGHDPYLRDILDRFVSNAVKFSNDTHQLLLGLAQTGEEVVITVADFGCGIAEKDVQLALGAFGQINRERFEQQGSGLGLSIASRYAELFNGAITLTPRTDGRTGTVAQLHLRPTTKDDIVPTNGVEK